MNAELLLDEMTLAKMTPEELRDYAEKKSRYILSKIEAAGDKVQKAKEAADFAKNDDNFHWWNKQAKKIDAHSDALVCINEAIAELNDLVRESIDFSCTTPAFAQVMYDNMDRMLADGFQDADGNFVKLSGNAEMQAGYVLMQTKLFTQQQMKYLEEQSVQDKEISSLKTELGHKTKIDKVQDSRLVELEKSMSEKDRIYAEQTQRMLKLRQMLAQKETIDSLQEKNISENRQAITQNADAIKVLMDFVKQKDVLDNDISLKLKNLEDLQKANEERNSSVPTIFSVAALLVSLISLVLTLATFVKVLALSN